MIKIELRRITTNERLSQETSNYAADLYVDDVKVAAVSNNGTGGCDSFHPFPPFRYDELAKIEARIEADYPKVDMSRYDMKPINPSLDLVCGDLLDRHQQQKRLKRLLGSKILYRHKPGEPLYSVKAAANRDGHISSLRAKYPAAIILNNLAPEDALKQFMLEVV